MSRNQYPSRHASRNTSYNSSRCCEILLGPVRIHYGQSKQHGHFFLSPFLGQQGWLERAKPESDLRMPLSREPDRKTLQEYRTSNAFPGSRPSTSECHQRLDMHWNSCRIIVAYIH